MLVLASSSHVKTMHNDGYSRALFTDSPQRVTGGHPPLLRPMTRASEPLNGAKMGSLQARGALAMLLGNFDALSVSCEVTFSHPRADCVLDTVTARQRSLEGDGQAGLKISVIGQRGSNG